MRFPKKRKNTMTTKHTGAAGFTSIPTEPRRALNCVFRPAAGQSAA